MKESHILFVDDDTDMLEAVESALKNLGFKVSTASDGPAALALLDKTVPDLIITDLRMQPMNGFELFQEVKKIPRFAKTPFFFLTAINDPLAARYSETLGVDAYITKPVDVDELGSIIKKKLESK